MGSNEYHAHVLACIMWSNGSPCPHASILSSHVTANARITWHPDREAVGGTWCVTCDCWVLDLKGNTLTQESPGAAPKEPDTERDLAASRLLEQVFGGEGPSRLDDLR